MTLHERMESLADLLIAGGLSNEERAQAERHVADCAACGALIRDARDFAAWAKGLIASDAPPADLEDRVIERFRAAGQTGKRRFVVGKRVFRVTGSIAAAVALIFLGSMVQVVPDATRGDVNAQQVEETRRDGAGTPLGAAKPKFHVHFTLDHDAHDHPAEPEEISSYKSRGLDNLSSAEADFRAHDRDGTHVNGSRSGDAKGRYAMTGEATPSSQKFNELFGLVAGGDPGASEVKQAELGLVKRQFEEGLGEQRPQIELRSRGASAAEKNGLAFGEGRAGKSTELPDAGTAEAPTATPSLPATSAGITGVFGKLSAFNRAQNQEAGKPAKQELSVAAADPPASRATPTPQENRKIIRNADVSLEVDSYDATYAKLAEAAAAEKGFVASANTRKLANGKIQATVVIRIPPDRFEAVIARFKELGTIRHQNIGSEDVTKAYIDLESRLAGKQTLAARLSKLLAEGKGTVKELMEVEVQLGATNEAIESIKGEIKYFDNRIGLSTISLEIAEKDLGQPFEYIQTLQANLALTVRDPDDAYARAQKEITDAGGQVVDSKMNRQSDGSSTGTIRGRVDADKFQALREALKKLGVATNDTVNQQKTAHGGQEAMPKSNAPLRKEQAVLDVTLSTPPLFVTRRSQLQVETPEVESAYANSRRAAEGAGGKIVDGSLTGRAERMVAVLRIQMDADKFTPLVESLKTAGKVKNVAVNSVLPVTAADGGAALLRERAEIELTLVSPPQLIADENGIGKSIRDTFSNSWAGMLWSIEKLFVGMSLAGPWVILLALGVFFWRRRRKTPPTAAP